MNVCNHEPAGNTTPQHPRRAALLLSIAVMTMAATIAAPAQAMRVGAGLFHSFLIKEDNSLWVWGNNFNGQLGDGTQVERSSPLKLSGLASIADARGGEAHSVALRGDGGVLAWGVNDRGQVGDGTAQQRTLPKLVMSGAAGLAVGANHTVVVKADGTVFAWGRNDLGQLGDGSTTNRNAPVRVGTLTSVTRVGAGFDHAFAVRSDGTLFGWGRNNAGQIGDGSTATRTSPVQVSGITNVIAVAGGAAYTVALRADGTVFTWGNNGSGQLGNGNTQARTTPAPVPNLTGVVAIAAGFDTTYALKSDGTVWGWGFNGFGNLGNGSTSNALSPVQVRNATGIVGIASGSDHLLLLRNDGIVFSVGANANGQLGDGSATNHGPPAQFSGIANATQLIAGGGQTYIMRNDGAVFGIGSNDSGQLGDGTTQGSGTPVRAGGMTGAKLMASGISHAVCVMNDGSMMSWGDNSVGQLGSGSGGGRTGPGVMPGVGGMANVAAGYYHSVGLKSDGTVVTWGLNDRGQLGDGTTTNRNTPTTVAGLTNVVAVAAGGFHSLALRSDGTVWAWGLNNNGQLGDGTKTDKLRPTQVAGLTGVTAIAGGGVHSVALRSDKTVRTWGGNAAGQLGDGTTATRTTPVVAIKVSDVAQIAAGGAQTFARRSDGSLIAWGRGGIAGQASDGDTLVPTVMPFLKNLKTISSNLEHTVAMTNDNRMFAWGSNVGQKLAIPYNQFTTGIGRVNDPFSTRATATSTPGSQGMIEHKATPGTFDSADIVIEFYNATIKNGAGTSGMGHFFMTSFPEEAASIDAGGSGPGWARTGRTFRAWNVPANAPANAVPVCRFYAAQPNSHFYTADATECQQLKDLNPTNNAALGWKFEGIAFHALMPQNNACTAGYYPVYRSYNNRFNADPALNDGNHRITPSYIDYLRTIRFFAYADERVAFCTPGSFDKGGDVQTTMIYPGPEVASGAPVSAQYIYSNNGPGRADLANIYMALPTNVLNWTVTCEGKNGAVCPANLNPDRLREGTLVLDWPAGGILTLTATGTAPTVPAGGDATMDFASATWRGNAAPDPTSGNDAPPHAQTVVRNAAACNFTLNPGNLSFSANPSTMPVRLLARSGCSWTAQSDQPWLTPAAPSGNGDATLQLNVQPNPSTEPRTATLNVAGTQVSVTQQGTLPPPAEECRGLDFQRSGDQIVASGLSGGTSVAVFADKACNWVATTSAPFVSLTAGAGKGSGTLTYAVLPNDGNARSAVISIGDKSFTVNQFGAGTSPNTGGSDGGGDSGGSSGGDGGSSGGASG